MNFKDDILSKPSLVAYWRLGAQDVWKHSGVVDAIPGPRPRNLITGGSFEDGTTNGWVGTGGFIAGTSTLSLDPSPVVGSNALKVVTPATANAGAMTSMPSLVLQAGVTYSVSLYVKEQAGGSALSRIAIADATGTETTIAGNVTIGTGYTRYQAFVTPAISGPATLYVRQNSATASTYWIDAVACIASAIDVGYEDGDGVVVPRLFATAQGAATVGGGAALCAQDKLAASTAFGGASGEYLETPDVAVLRLTSAFTLLALVNPTDRLANYPIIAKGNLGTDRAYEWILDTSGLMEFFATGAGGVASVGAIPTGIPSLLAVTFAAAALNFYINGALDRSVAWSATTAANAQAVRLANRGNAAECFKGSMQDVAIFNGAALTANELLALAKEAGLA